MATRHKPGDIVIKKANQGFARPRLVCQIGTGSENHDSPPHCWVEPCGDDDCIEWPTLWILDENMKPTGDFAFHVEDHNLEEYDQIVNSSINK